MERVALFVSCMVDMFHPKTAVASVAVLERRGAEVSFPTRQTCCGQFAYNAGHWREAAFMARNLVAALGQDDQVDAIVGLSGSCVAMVRSEYPKLLAWDAAQGDTDRTEPARVEEQYGAVRERLVEFSQWLAPRINAVTDTPPRGLAVAWHNGCHMRRVLKVTQEPVAILAALGVEIREPEDSDQCCGFGGTYSMAEPQISTALADAKLEAVRAVDASALVGCDWGCLLQLGGRMSRRGSELPVLHLADVVDLADCGELAAPQLARAGQFVPAARP